MLKSDAIYWCYTLIESSNEEQSRIQNMKSLSDVHFLF